MSKTLLTVKGKTSVVYVGRGPAGATGPKGDPNQGTVFTQSSPSATWTLNHNLGFKPAVTVYSAGGMQVGADVVHISNNQTQIFFASPQAGTARLI